MSQRAAGERARWLAAVLIVATIAATGVIVRLWPAAAPAPLLASRPILLYQAPVALPQVSVVQPPVVRRVRLHPSTDARGALSNVEGQADPRSPAKAGHYVRENVRRLDPDVVRLHDVRDVAAVAPDAPLEMPTAEIRAEPAGIASPIHIDEPLAAVEVVASADVAVDEVAEDPLPVTSSSRGIVEVPAVAVTRAVTIAGRGIMTGLRATGAILRAPF